MRHEKLVDLHLHSTYSDGRLTPTQLVNAASERNLAAVALADHDSVDGVGEFTKAAAIAGTESISCVELSCLHGGRDLHILGYGVDPGDRALLRMLAKFRDTRENRGREIVEKLAVLGVYLDVEGILEKKAGGALGRPHIAEALIEGGYAKDFNEVFDKYLGENCPAYVDKYRLSPREAVHYIHESRGLAFVAHPGYYLEDMDLFVGLLDEEFDGIEVYHSKHNGKTVQWLKAIAKERGLLESGGSDFHGFIGRDNIGEPEVPYECYEQILERLPGRMG